MQEKYNRRAKKSQLNLTAKKVVLYMTLPNYFFRVLKERL